MPASQRFVIDAAALDRTLASDHLRAMTDPHVDVTGSADMSIRMAEFWEVIDIVRAATGRTFASEAEADQALFDGARGGGFGIRESLRAAVLDAMSRKT